MPQVPIYIPEMGSEAARVSVWLVGEGEAVTAGDRVLEIVIPGATVDFHAPVTGRLETRILFPGDIVHHDMIAGMIFSSDDVETVPCRNLFSSPSMASMARGNRPNAGC